MKTKSFHLYDEVLLHHELSIASDEGLRANLAIVFCSPSFNLHHFSATFQAEDIQVVGCTTAGEIYDTELNENSASVLLMEMNPAHFKILFESNEGDIRKTASQIRKTADESFENPALFVLTSGLLNDGEEIVAGLKQGKQKEIPIFGGLSGDELQIKQTTIFTNQEVSTDAICAIVFDANYIEINGLATSGWQALGSEHTVTKAEGNTIYSINDTPALDYFIRFFGYHDDANIKDKSISTISAQYPFQIMKEGGYSVLRSPIMGDEIARSLTLVGRVNEGDKFRFSISPGIEVIEETVANFQQFRNDNRHDADALILVSCKGRHAALGPFLEDEVSQIYNFWKKPMVGFLSYGEIGNLNNGICDFHNETCSLITIKEKL
jgi:hypothetical protein